MKRVTQDSGFGLLEALTSIALVGIFIGIASQTYKEQLTLHQLAEDGARKDALRNYVHGFLNCENTLPPLPAPPRPACSAPGTYIETFQDDGKTLSAPSATGTVVGDFRVRALCTGFDLTFEASYKSEPWADLFDGIPISCRDAGTPPAQRWAGNSDLISERMSNIITLRDYVRGFLDATPITPTGSYVETRQDDGSILTQAAAIGTLVSPVYRLRARCTGADLVFEFGNASGTIWRDLFDVLPTSLVGRCTPGMDVDIECTDVPPFIVGGASPLSNTCGVPTISLTGPSILTVKCYDYIEFQVLTPGSARIRTTPAGAWITFATVGSIRGELRNLGGTIVLDLSLVASWALNTDLVGGNGADTFIVIGKPSGAPLATNVSANIRMFGGNSNDSFNFGYDPRVPSCSALRTPGNIQIWGGLGTDTLNFGGVTSPPSQYMNLMNKFYNVEKVNLVDCSEGNTVCR